MPEFRTAYVMVDDILAGILQEDDTGYRFCYDEAYLKREGAAAISLTLPLTTKAYHSTILFPFFDGLIPEGWLLDQVVKNWKLNERDRFGILLVACKDPIGNVSIWEERG